MGPYLPRVNAVSNANSVIPMMPFMSTAEEGEVVTSDSAYKHVPNDVRVKRKFGIMLKSVQDEATPYGGGPIVGENSLT
jgi:hypothetical protein